MNDHQHTLDWASEGPLWFCACGAEFFPQKPPIVQSSPMGTLTMRTSLASRLSWPGRLERGNV